MTKPSQLILESKKEEIKTEWAIPTQSKTLVIKLGTSVLTHGSQRLNKARMIELVRQCSVLYQQGYQLVMVTSGAVAAGREYLNYPTLPNTLTSKQMLAAVGQCQLMSVWSQLFAIYDIHIGQMLLTRADLEDRERYLNARDTLNALLKQNVIPIINENDAVAVAEIKVGDNDNLSALVAILADADHLYLLTDQKGLYDGDPRYNPEAKLILEVQQIDEELSRMATDSGTTLGTGGMSTKVKAAQIATRAGIDVTIASGFQNNIMLELLSNRTECTHFISQNSRLDGRKRWLLSGVAPSAQVIIDPGAQEALLKHGKSLLVSGIVRVNGLFERGDVIKIVTESNRLIAHGVSHYSAQDLNKIKGLHSQAIEGILGYVHAIEAVHRDNLVLI